MCKTDSFELTNTRMSSVGAEHFIVRKYATMLSVVCQCSRCQGDIFYTKIVALQKL